MPVRKIGITSRSVPTAFDSLKTGSVHMCESTLETDFCYHLEFDPLVKSYDAQPVKLFYNNEKGRRTRYVPDFHVTYTKQGSLEHSRESTLFEIKEKVELVQNKNDLALRFKIAEEHCTKIKSQFVVHTEDFIRSPKLKTYKFLYRYLAKDSAPKLRFDIMEIARRLETFQVQELIDSIDGDAVIKGKSLSNVWHLVANHHLHTDWNTKLTNATVLTIKP